MPKRFWQFRNSSNDSAELLLYGDISNSTWWGDEVTPKEFKEDLDALGEVDDITVRINSGGGDVFAASTIGNLLEKHTAKVTAVIDGLCASAATIVACHCNAVKAAEDSIYMIHPVQIGLMGYMDAAKLQQYLDALAAIRENIVSLYARKTGRDKEEVGALMDATSWWTAAEAKENAFVDELIEAEKPVVEDRGGLLFVNSVSMNMPFNEAPKFVQDCSAATAAGRLVNKVPAMKKPEKEKKEDTMEIKTIDELRNAYPELCAQLEEAAANNARAEERARIKDIAEMSVEGCEEIAKEAMFENPVSANEFAAKALKAVKAQGVNAATTKQGGKDQQAEEEKAFLNALRKDAKESGADKVKAAPVDGANGEDEFLNAIREVNKKK